MTYEELVEKVTKAYANADAKNVNEHVAVQFNVYGEGEGAFYVEVADGNVDVQPFEYYDRDATVITPADIVADLAEGKITVADAYALEQVQVAGNLEKAALLGNITMKKAAAKKPAAKKATAEKKTTAKKATAEKKPAAKKATTTKKAATSKKAAEKKEEPAKAVAEAAKEVKKEEPAKKATAAKKAPAKKEEASQIELKLK